jgi:uncharacterized protein (TIGR02145 family)
VQSIQKTSYDSSISSEANSAEYIDNFRDQRDGQSYKLIRIGNTVWMAENLNYAVDAQSFCVNCEIYGRLYTWESAKNACPQGMHPPTESEWNVLAEYYGGQKIAGDKLKSNFQSKLKASFSAKYGGTGSMYGKYDHKNYSDGIIGTWWADPGTSHRIIRSYSSILTREVGDTKSDAHSLRCVQD